MGIMIMKTRPGNRADSGFSMIEMLIAMVVASIIFVAIYSAYKFQRDTFEAQDQITEMQQNIRSALWYMVREIRMASHDPKQKGNADLEIVQKNRFRFTMDITDDPGTGPPDGDVNDSNEDVTYGFSNANDPDGDGIIAASGAAPLGRDVGGGFQSICENISAVEFNYILEDGTTTLAPNNYQKTQIRSIQISILARAPYPDRNFKNNNMNYQTAAGTNWGPYNDNYRRLLLTTTVMGRNLGM